MLPGAILFFILVPVVSYLFGSINSSIIVTRFFGFKGDIRKVGSGNAGFTNVLRSVGVVPAIFTFFGDCIKTVAALVVCEILAGCLLFCSPDPLFFFFLGKDYQIASITFLFSGFFVIIGHVYPCFFNFKGGKAIVCLLPITLFFDYRVSLLALSVFLIVLFLFKMVSLASMVGTSSLPLFNLLIACLQGRPISYSVLSTFFLLLITFLVIIKHSGNIVRIKNHTEYKIGQTRK